MLFRSIEFSIPKLLFGNNFDEVEEKQFEEIIKRLRDILDHMGVQVLPETLRGASVSAIHYSKNIPLMDYSTPSMILKELSKIDLNQRLDLNQTDFRNGGPQFEVSRQFLRDFFLRQNKRPSASEDQRKKSG